MKYTPKQFARKIIAHLYPNLHKNKSQNQLVDYLIAMDLLDVDGAPCSPIVSSSRMKALGLDKGAAYATYHKAYEESLYFQILRAMENAERVGLGLHPLAIYDEEPDINDDLDDFICWVEAQDLPKYDEVLSKAKRFKEALEIINDLKHDLYLEAVKQGLDEILTDGME